jgi:uncharacterized protein involved in exopolysaccharide biosynthesis
LAFVNEMLGTINDSLLQVEGKKEAFRSNNKTFSLSNEGGAVFSRLQELDKEVLRVQEQQRYYAYLRKYLQEASSFDEVVSPSVSLVEDPLVGELVKELSKLYDERRMAQSGLRKDNPMLERIDLKIRVLRDNLLENLKNALSAAALKEKELQVRLREAEGALSQLPRTERELLGIERKVAITSELYNFLPGRNGYCPGCHAVGCAGGGAPPYDEEDLSELPAALGRWGLDRTPHSDRCCVWARLFPKHLARPHRD